MDMIDVKSFGHVVIFNNYEHYIYLGIIQLSNILLYTWDVIKKLGICLTFYSTNELECGN